MIEAVKSVFFSAAEKFTDKIVEVFGWSVATTLAIILKLSIIEAINGVLQTIVLIISIAVGIATFIYTRRKTKRLEK